MNKYNIYSFLIGLVVCLLASCVDEDVVKRQDSHVVEGIPVTVTLNYATAQSAVQTRIAQSEEVEHTIYRLYAIAFDENGNVAGRNAYENVNNSTGKGTIEFSMTSGTRQIFLVGNPGSAGSLSFATLRAVQTLNDFKNLTSILTDPEYISRMTFLMVGQMKTKDGGTNIVVNENGAIVSDLDGPVQLERVDSRITFKVRTEGNYANMVFTPKYYQVVNIPQGTYLWPREKTEISEDAPYYDYSEQLVANGETGYATSVQSVFDGERQFEGDSKASHYFEFYIAENRLNPKAIIYSSEKSSERDQQKAGWGSEDYYANAQSLYALRERKTKGETVEGNTVGKPGQEHEQGEEWVFANEHSTYVVIRGSLSYQDNSTEGVGKFIHAEVTYRIHLGSTGNVNENGNGFADNPSLANNYDTNRNTHYTYTVTITGVNSMRVEVQEDKEVRPGVEGSVIVAGGQVKSVDAHYCRDIITLTRGNIMSGLSWAVSTPLQNGMKVFNKEVADAYIKDKTTDVTALQTNLNLNDYKWVKFGINKEYPFIENEEHEWGHDHNHDDYYCREDVLKYPGDQMYDGGEGNDRPAPAFGGTGQSSEYYNGNIVKLYDVNQLLNHLYVEAQNNNSTIFDKVDENPKNDVVTISVFIDEYVYYYYPDQYYYKKWNETTESDLQNLWKRIVNGDNRMLHICEAGAQYSPDGQTSWAESVVTISQSPVYTFYNPNAAILESAWGTETIMEVGDTNYPNGELDAKSITSLPGNKGNSLSNGRQNQLNIIPTDGNLKWSDVVSVYTKTPQLKDQYRNIWYACLLRNRDLDGDNVVDPEEIRWYLASIDQLSDIWIGEDAIPNAKLYTAEIQNNFVEGQHVASSSYYNNSPSETWLLWAEEGVSRSQRRPESWKDENNDWQTRRNQYRDKAYPYRCIRNLGLKLEESEYATYPEPNDYVIKGENKRVANGETYTELTIDVSRLNANAVRGFTDVPLPSPLTERDEYRNNRPYRKFAVIQSSTDDNDGIYNGDWYNIYENETNGNPCPRGYRVPNQREMVLLYTTYPELFEGKGDNEMFACKTSFSLKTYGPYSWEKDPDGGFLPNNGMFENSRSCRVGYVLFGNGNFSILHSNSSDYWPNLKVYVRCVRDMRE